MRNPTRYIFVCFGIVLALGLCPSISRGAGDEPLPDRRTYIRRLSLDLTGVPPTDAQVQAFLSDKSPDAYKKLTDQMLATRQFEASLKRAEKQDLAQAAKLDSVILNFDSLTLLKTSAAYLGIGVDVPDSTLRSQLRLPEGAGLVINYVDPKGPSASSVHLHDVLQKLGDQILVNGDQFAALVRMHKPGDSIALTLIREAQPITVTVKLGDKQVEPQADVSNRSLSLWTLSEAADKYTAADRSILLSQGADGSTINKFVVLQPGGQVLEQALVARQTGPVSFADDKSIAICQLDGPVERITLLDRATARVLFTTPLQSEEDWKKIPEDSRRRLDPFKAELLRLIPAQPAQTQPASK